MGNTLKLHIRKYELAVIILIALLNSTMVFAHTGKYQHIIIIDTDAAADDLRTISMLLGSPEIKTIAITTSDGALTPQEGLIKVQSLLRDFGHDGIPTGFGKAIQTEPPRWRELSQSITWGDENRVDTVGTLTASDLIIYSIALEEEPVTIVCLGSLTNITKALKNKPELKKIIAGIVWYNNSIHPNFGTNYEIDKLAAEYILESGIKIDVITPFKNEITFSNTLFESVQAIPSPYAQKIAETHHQKTAYEMVRTEHFKLWDDLVALYLLHPEIFEKITFEQFPQHSLNYLKKDADAEKGIIEILSEKINERGIVFSQFPNDPKYYREDVQQHMDQIIARHGYLEWKIIVQTNEFHDHLGIYSIVGAKMGLRAREYFNVGRDEMTVVSFAGDRPPISCLNDGLQVCTGATLGQGTIMAITEDLFQKPKAIFTYKNSSISIELKPEYFQVVRNDIKKGIEQHGALTDAYWKFIRELAIQYWLDWDRKEIFNIEGID